MEQIKLTYKYWYMVLKSAFRYAQERSNMKGAALIVLIAFALFVLALLLNMAGILPDSFQILVGDFSSDFRIKSVYGLGVVFLFLVIFIFALLYTPARIHNEQVTSSTNLQQEIDKLHENTKPKLELRFDVDHPSSIFRELSDVSSFKTLFRISLINSSVTESVEGIHVFLERVNSKPPLDFLPAELGFMHNHEKRLNPASQLFIDVIQLRTRGGNGEVEQTLNFCFVDSETKDRQRAFIRKPRQYKFVIKATGSNTASVQKTFELFLKDQSDETSISIREKNDG